MYTKWKQHVYERRPRLQWWGIPRTYSCFPVASSPPGIGLRNWVFVSLKHTLHCCWYSIAELDSAVTGTWDDPLPVVRNGKNIILQSSDQLAGPNEEDPKSWKSGRWHSTTWYRPHRKDNTPILYSSLSSKVTKRNSVCKKKSQLEAKHEGKF